MSNKGTTHSFESYRNDNRTYWRCRNTIVKGQKTIRCNYNQRDDNHKKYQTNANKMKCSFTIEIEEQIFKYSEFRQIHDDSVNEALIELVGNKNVPLQTAVSNEMSELLNSAYKKGFERGKTNPTNPQSCSTYVERDIPKVSLHQLRKQLLCKSEKKRNATIKEFAQLPSVCLTIDVGHFFGKNYLSFDLVHPFANIRAFTYKLVLFPDGSVFDYSSTIESVISELQLLGVNITGVICDGCRPQVRALSFTEDLSIQLSFPETCYHILFSPCVCHKINNIIKQFYNVDAEYKSIIDNCRLLSRELRRTANIPLFETKCPSFCKTRWLSDYPIVSYIIKNIGKIEEIARTRNIQEPSLHLIDIEYVMGYLYKLITQLEANTASISVVYPLLSEFSSNIQNLTNERSTIAVRMSKYLQEAVMKNIIYQYPIFSLAFSLTPKGRHEIRDSALLKELTPSAIENTTFGAVAPDSIEHENALTLSEDLIEEIDVVYDEELEATIDPDFSDYPNGVFDLAKHAEKGILMILIQFAVDDSTIDEIIQSYKYYLTIPEFEMIDRIGIHDKRYLWAHGSHLNDLSAISFIGIALEPLIASEAPSERTFSLLRGIFGSNRANTLIDLLYARLIMIQTS